MFSFLEPNYLYLLLFLPFLYILGKKDRKKALFSKEVMSKILVKNYGFSKNLRNLLVIFSLAFIVIAISRPVIKGKEIEIKDDKMDVVAAIDISDSMRVDDIYPNRFEFAKNKFHTFLDEGVDKRVGVITFASKAYAISPITSDLNSLKFLIDNLKFENFSLKGTSIMSALEATKELSKSANKVLLIFTDGGDEGSFKNEIEYAKKHGITVFVYLTATDKGALFKAQNGDMVQLKANPNIASLATSTGGVLMRNLGSYDMKVLNDEISKKNSEKDSDTTLTVGQVEFFYLPLAFAVLLIFMASFSLPLRSKS